MPDDKPDSFFHPIIYVRGFAMTRGDIDDTTADPFCGFNLGSTVYRATVDRDRTRKYIFQSPVVRLASDYGYSDVYTDGLDIMDQEWNPGATLSRRSIIVFRYYDPASNLLGSGKTPPIEEFARNLSELIARVRDLVSRNPANRVSPETFRCYLVAHSMGGLVCRAFLQNRTLDVKHMYRYIDKFFTYATPHNGIEIEIGSLNVPKWLSKDDISNFNRTRMAGYLDLQAWFDRTKRVDWIPEAFPDTLFGASRTFCLVGTNRMDYEVAQGLSRTFVGNGSDGLVRIENATLSGFTANGTPSGPVAKAYVYRSHSGFYGIVNSEESYQNLTRFLFGDYRIDVWIDVDDLRLPADVRSKADAGQTVDALYQFEVFAAPRGKLWYLTRRVAEEDSVAVLKYQDWKKGAKPASLYVSSVFLDTAARITNSKSSAYSLTLRVRVPDYEVERKLWLDQHFEGGYLFQDQLKVEIFDPGTEGPSTVIKYDWQSQQTGPPTRQPATRLVDGKLEVVVPFDGDKTPGVRGQVRFMASAWNEWNR